MKIYFGITFRNGVLIVKMGRKDRPERLVLKDRLESQALAVFQERMAFKALMVTKGPKVRLANLGHQVHHFLHFCNILFFSAAEI